MEKSNSQILKRKNLQKDFNITSKIRMSFWKYVSRVKC